MTVPTDAGGTSRSSAEVPVDSLCLVALSTGAPERKGFFPF